MAAATKTKNPYVGKGSAGQNRLDRRQKTAKEGKCQWCHTKVPLEEQFVVYNDFEAKKTIRSKNAAKAGREKMSHYCDECATKRQKVKQAGDFDKASGKPRGRKPGAVKKTASKAKSVTRKPAGDKKRVVKRKTAVKKTAAKSSDPS